VITDGVNKTGWTIGGGIETMLWKNWFARGEYRYSDYGTINNTDVRNCCGGGAGVVQTVNYSLRVRTSATTFGLAYKFGN
jgi:outer membrane immunogenic protein